MRNFYRCVFAVMAAAILAASATMPSDAAPRSRVVRPSPVFDGLWSVSIITQIGDCSKGFRYPLRIVDGYVTKADTDPTYAVAGAVARSGAIGVTVSGGGQTATGVGRLSRTFGRGMWHTVNNECRGNWTAERRG
jgi:hypothetical protein